MSSRMTRCWATFVLAAVATCGVADHAAAQDWSFGVNWGGSFPVGETRDYIDRASARNFGIDFRRYMSPEYSMGIAFNWNVLDQKTLETIVFPDGAVTGTQFRYINAIPFLLTGHYYLGEEFASSRPYVGLGLGAIDVLQRFEIGLAATEQSNWHFGVAPEVGMLFSLGRFSDTDLVLSARFTHAFDAGESLTGEKARYSYLSALIGVSFK